MNKHTHTHTDTLTHKYICVYIYLYHYRYVLPNFLCGPMKCPGTGPHKVEAQPFQCWTAFQLIIMLNTRRGGRSFDAVDKSKKLALCFMAAIRHYRLALQAQSCSAALPTQTHSYANSGGRVYGALATIRLLSPAYATQTQLGEWRAWHFRRAGRAHAQSGDINRRSETCQ